MPQLKIQVSDWQSEPRPRRGFEGLDIDLVTRMDERVAALVAPLPPGATTYAARATAFIDQFAPELTSLFGQSPDVFKAALAGASPSAQWPTVDWEALREGGQGAVAVGRTLAAAVFGAVLLRGLQEGPSVAAGPVVPRVFLAEEGLSEGVMKAFKQDEAAHKAWREGLATAEDLLRVCGNWFSQACAADATQGQAAHIGMAMAELRDFGDRAMFVRKRAIREALYSVSIDPPQHLLSGYPTYDNCDLEVGVIPYVAKIIADNGLVLDDGMERANGGATVILRRWSSTDSADLERLASLFRRLACAVRKPAGRVDEDLATPDLGPMLETLGCRPVAGLAPCWRVLGEDVLGFRAVEHYRDGMLQKRRLQISAVFGSRAGQPGLSPVTDEIMRRGGAACWVDNGLVLIAHETDMPVRDEDLRRALEGFVGLAAELRLQLYREQVVVEMLTASMLPAQPEPGAPLSDWIARLRGLPARLEVDFDRMRRHWYRQRIVDDLTTRIAVEPVDIVRNIVGAVDNDEDRSFVRARFVMLLFGRDAEAALSELERVEFGPARHEATVELLEAAAEGGNAEMLERVFSHWHDVDARRLDYEVECGSLLDQAVSGLGLARLHQGYAPETAPAVCCDWLNFIFSRSPRSRRDPDWLARLDALTNDERALQDMHLDRLSDLFLTLQRHDLPGRRGVITAISAAASASPHRAYYEAKLNLSLHSPEPGSAA